MRCIFFLSLLKLFQWEFNVPYTVYDCAVHKFLILFLVLFFYSLTLGYSDCWDVCAQLGQCETYSQLSARQELMAFSLTHCPPSSIQNLLAASSSLQTQVPFCPLRSVVPLFLYMNGEKDMLASVQVQQIIFLVVSNQ